MGQSPKMAELSKLIANNPEAYRRAIARLAREDPDRFALLIAELCTALKREIGTARRSSSIAAIAVGDVDALLVKHGHKPRCR